MKDKKSKDEIKQLPGKFYYETIGMTLLILSITIVAKLGSVGSLLTILFKVLFGDWYLLLVLLIIIIGLYLILNHKGFNFKNQKFIGYSLCLVGFLMFTHFSIHSYVLQQGGSYFSQTWLIYKNYISYKTETYLGGGLIGAIMFYIFYSLIGKIGVTLVSIIFIVLGITMIINKPFTEIGKIIINFFAKFKKYGTSFNDFFKYEIGKNDNKSLNIYSLKKKVTLKHLDDYKNINYYVTQEKYIEEIKGLIVSLFNNLNLKYRLNQSFISFSSSFLSYFIYDEFDCNIIGNKLSEFIEDNIYLSKIGNVLNIEINNKFVSILSLKDLLTKQPLLYNNYLIPIGLNYKNQAEEIDFSKEANMLIIGDFNVGIKTFICDLIFSTIIKLGTECIEFNLFDEFGDFNDYSFLFKKIDNGDIKEYLSKIIIEIDDRVNLFSLKAIHQIDEYNLSNSLEKKEQIIRKIYVIELDDFNQNHNYQYIDDKIMYLIQVGRDVGIYVFFISRNLKKVSSVLFSLFKYKFVFNCGNIENRIIESNHLSVLNNKGECLFYRDNNIKRIQTSKITKEEVLKILKAK